MHTEVLLSEMKYIRQKTLLLRIMVVANIKKNTVNNFQKYCFYYIN